VFVLNDVVNWAEQDYNNISQYGGVIGIEINWDCNLDFDIKYCVPKYSFRRLDDPNTSIAKGWNFRYANYYQDYRTLYKATGIRFVLLVSGSAGKFSFIPLVIKIGSGFGESAPRHLMMVPLVFENETKGVIELASFKEFTAQQTEFIDNVSRIIASSLDLISRKEKTKAAAIFHLSPFPAGKVMKNDQGKIAAPINRFHPANQ